MFFFILFASILSLKPLYLIAGFGQSPIYSTVTEPSLYPECPADINRVLLRTATTTNTNFLSSNAECVAKLLRVQLNETTGKVEQLPGIITNSSEIGSTTELTSTFSPIIEKAKSKGYVDNVNMFSVGYNYILHPVTSYSVYDKLKEKIEQVYESTKEKAVIISFSQGTSFASIFLSNYSNLDWVKQYIDSVIFLAPAFAGWPSFSQMMNQKLTPFTDHEELKKSIMRMPGLHIMLPNYEVFSHRTVIYNLHEDFDQHNATFVFEFLKSQGKVDDEAERIYHADVEKYLMGPIPEPPVPSLVVYNDGVTQTVSYVINRHQNNKITSLFGTPADGTVTSEGAEYACGNWKNVQCTNLHDSTSHSNVVSHEKTIDSVFNFIDIRVKPLVGIQKVGLFLASGFQGSPLYATVTDPSKAPMCPANMKNYLFYTTFIGNMYRYIDDQSSQYWLSNDCWAMLTRVELNEDETATTFAPGIHIKSSRFGEYNLLLSYTGIITRAYQEGWTHYKNMFGVGYNYMLHPLMSGEVYEELKQRIEKYYDETGQKAVVTGHSQGTSFVEIFITDYVTKEWAEKYVAGVIFYAPAFAGWGTYGRSVSGNYGSGFPDSKPEMKTSTSRMPGLHIMMPNEGVYGSKTVIKNFPNDGDQSNASYVCDLLKQLGRLDETAEKIFHLTDKYRKPALPEPPVPSLVIYNDYIGTGNGYTYNKATNSVSGFSGSGDGTVSSDGPDYACSHWENVTCFNYHRSGIGHSNIQTTQETLDLTFEFLEKVRHSKPLPKNKTYKLTEISGKYADEDFTNLNMVPSNKMTYENNGGSKSSYPLSSVFDNNKKTYWISDTPNSDTFSNTITVTFTESVTLEAILFDTAYFTYNKYRDFQGFPTRLNIYTSVNGKDFQLNSAFIGTPVFPWTRIQCVLPEQVTCDKIKIEFDDVTLQTMTGSSTNVVLGNLLFIKKAEFDYTAISKAKGLYANYDYVNALIVPSSQYTYTNNGGSKSNYPIENVFDNNNNTYWIADKPNSADFINTITVNFKKPVNLEAFLYDTAYATKNQVRTFHGFPTTFKVYTSLDGSEFKLNTIFHGNPVYPWSRTQFVFKELVTCDKIKFEFTEVTTQTMVGSSANPVIGNLLLLQPIDSLTSIGVTGNYADANYVQTHQVSKDNFERTNNGGEKTNYPFNNLFDGNAKSFWMANTPNSEDFINTITINFKEEISLQAILYDTAYATSGQSRAFHGFPIVLNAYKSSGNNKFELISIFKGNPVFPWTRMQFALKEPVQLKSLKLEFAEVTKQTMLESAFNPVSAQLLFIKSDTPITTPTSPPTVPPTSVPTKPPTSVPTSPPTSVPTSPPTEPPTSVPTSPPTEPPTSLPTASIKPPTETRTMVPTLIPTIVPTAGPIDSCEGNSRCDIEGTENNPGFVTVTTSNFVGYSFDGDGGAVHLINSGVKCENIQFVKCKSNSGGGGAIYINNNIEITKDIAFENLVFTECEARYGSAVYIYSSSTSNSVVIKHCTFASNVASSSQTGNHLSYGGSAMFIAAKKGLINDCSLTNNKGEGGALKICNHFTKSKMIHQLDESLFVISDCSFIIEKDSKCVVYYVRGNEGTSFELRNCRFSGSLSDQSHFIDGESISNNCPKLFVNSCKFSETSDKSLNNNKDDYLTIDIEKQEFKKENNSSNNNTESKGSNKTFIYIIIIVGIVIVIAVLVIVLVLILKKKKPDDRSANPLNDIRSNSGQYLLDSSLI